MTSIWDFSRLQKYLDILYKDIYTQYEDEGHTAWMKDAIYEFISPISQEISSVLDVGCGVGNSNKIFNELGIDNWTGCTLDLDEIILAKNKGMSLMFEDFSFLKHSSNSFDLIFARHSLEHSPMPLITLMEWYRVSKKYLLVILPAPEYWGVGGKNHYYVLPDDNWRTLFEVAGWKELKFSLFYTTNPRYLEFCATDIPRPKEEVEYRFLLEK